VVYTHPEGQNSGAGTISGNTLRYRQITLTLASPTSGQAVGAFSTATRTANVTKQ
jgi:hypothetical protein